MPAQRRLRHRCRRAASERGAASSEAAPSATAPKTRPRTPSESAPSSPSRSSPCATPSGSVPGAPCDFTRPTFSESIPGILSNYSPPTPSESATASGSIPRTTSDCSRQTSSESVPSTTSPRPCPRTRSESAASASSPSISFTPSQCSAPTPSEAVSSRSPPSGTSSGSPPTTASEPQRSATSSACSRLTRPPTTTYGRAGRAHPALVSFLVLSLCLPTVESSLKARRPPNISPSKQCDHPCYNNGTCVDGVCVCPPGWAGANCNGCSGRVRKTSASGVINDGPLSYNPLSSCMWIVSGANRTGALHLKLDEFQTECFWDHLYVYDGDGVDNNLIAALSGYLNGNELTVPSGKAILYFTSDPAISLPGFNISYTYDRCVQDCSGQGQCVAGRCRCNEGFWGEACQVQHCMAEGGENATQCGYGKSYCEAGKCVCDGYFHGEGCKTLLDYPAFDPVPIPPDNQAQFHARASHAAVPVSGTVWLYGGYMLNSRQAHQLVTFDTSSHLFAAVDFQVDGEDVLRNRYDHSMVHHEGSLYVFGGVVDRKSITNEFWRFDIATRTWFLIGPDSANLDATPKAVAGHTAHVYGDNMYVVFGYSPYYGYLHYVQIYNFVTKTWANPRERGGTDPFVIGRFGHSSVLSPSGTGKKQYIYVFGGSLNEPNTQKITGDLLMYDIAADSWSMVNVPSGTAQRFRHTSVLMNGFMVSFGGNSQNETITDHSGCYSNDVFAFDTVCQSWSQLRFEKPLPTGFRGLSRYGHTAVVVEDAARKSSKMYVFGGFTGVARSDVWVLTLAESCPNFAAKASDCSSPMYGIRCYFDDSSKTGPKCKPIEQNTSMRQQFREFIKTNSPRLQTGCPQSDMQLDETPCADIKDCLKCVEREACGWCPASGRCQSGAAACLDDVRNERRVCAEPPALKELAVAQREPRACALAANCFACKSLPHCVWANAGSRVFCMSKADQALILAEHNRLQAERYAALGGADSVSMVRTLKGNLPYHHFNPLEDRRFSAFLASSNASCLPPCASFDSCAKCIHAQCMWCPAVRRCIPTDTFMINFPYGQCPTWVNYANSAQCQLDPLECGAQKNCTECQSVGPRCGWCDYGDGTGTGRCLRAGSDNGPAEAAECSAAHNRTWFFTGEPDCQCNGHSRCEGGARLGGPSGTSGPSGPNGTNGTSSTTALGFPAGSALTRLHSAPAARRQCTRCEHRTRGQYCQLCADGFYGDPRNGAPCQPCQCNGQANRCDQDTGKCYCMTKGATGDYCDACEFKYIGDPKNGKPCTFELIIDFVFTFNIEAEDFRDRYVRQINFFSTPFKKDTDVQFSVHCVSNSSALVAVNLSANVFDAHPGPHQRLSPQLPCTADGLKRTYSANDFDFGPDSNTTFYVKITNFDTPIRIQISFAQSPPINWVLFFIIFAACFIVLLVVAGVLLLIKQRIRNAGHEANIIIENERMAARPKTAVQLHLPLVRQNTQPTPIAVEPCRHLSTAIYTVVVRLPTGGRPYTPCGTSGLAVASSLCHLAQSQLAMLEPPNEADSPDNTNKSAIHRFIPDFMRRRQR